MSRSPRFMERASTAVTRWTGSSWAFALALLTIVVWGFTYPLFNSFDTWQLVVNTGTTIVTFLMVFLIQRSQNKDSLAIQLKLNELVAAVQGASNRLIAVEDLSEAEVRALAAHFRELAKLAKKDADATCSHSIEEARKRHTRKRKRHTAEGADGPPG